VIHQPTRKPNLHAVRTRRFYIWAVFCKVIVSFTILIVRYIFHHSTLSLFPLVPAFERVVSYRTLLHF